MGESFSLEPVDWITAGAVGEPGSRAFYLQAARGSAVVAIVLEKEQVRRLAELAQELLARVGVVVTPDDLDTSAQTLREPVVAAWRAGVLSLGMDDQGERFLIEAEEFVPPLEEDAGGTPSKGVARFVLERDHLVALAAHAAYAVEAGARERCRLCSLPIDPVAGHVCPASNGHGPLRV